MMQNSEIDTLANTKKEGQYIGIYQRKSVDFFDASVLNYSFSIVAALYMHLGRIGWYCAFSCVLYYGIGGTY